MARWADILKYIGERKEVMDNNKYNYDLDVYQKNAVVTENRNTLVVAAPGSGKTTVIINRIKYLIEEKKVIPESIIVITFTKAAAENMKNRYKNMSSNNRIPFFGTFHGLFYRILQGFYGKINIIEEGAAYMLVSKFLSSFLKEVTEEKTKETLNDISMYKSKNMSFNKFNPHIDKEVFKECFSIYERYKLENKLLDFDDLQIRCKELFIKYPEILEKYRLRFKHMLVDEFQDCDETQIELLQLLNKYNNLFAVGDEDQSIYGFRGAIPECMVEFNRYFLSGAKLFLSVNYRSPQNIIEIAKMVIDNNKIRNYKELHSWKKTISKVNIIKGQNENVEASLVCNDIINNIKKSRQLFSDVAVLYRTNVESRAIIDIFVRNKIPFVLMDKSYNFYEHFICKDIIAYLRLSLDLCDVKSFIRIVNKPYRYISRLSIERLKRVTSKEDCFDFIRSLEDVPLFQIKATMQLKKDILKLNNMNLVSAIEYIIKNIGYSEYLKSYCLKFKMNYEDLLIIIEDLKMACSEFKSIKDFICHVEMVYKELELNKHRKDDNGIILSTIHGVKGMEFKNIYIFNCNEETIPHVNSIKNNLEEERRLFYVAITRTIENLTICFSENIKGKPKDLSRFVGECNLNL